jgi:hypothetical protein
MSIRIVFELHELKLLNDSVLTSLVQVGSTCSDQGLRRAWVNVHPEMSLTLRTGPMYDVVTMNLGESFARSFVMLAL